jgi:ABC-type sugar transport system ATPase subunit
VTSDAIHLETRGIGKSFGATRALDDVSVAVRAGTVHAFVGENGAGKSTLGQIIAGAIAPDQGELLFAGEVVTFRAPREALDRGIALVAQEVALVPQLTVAENIYLGAEPRRASVIDRRRLRADADRLAAEAGFDVRADAKVGSLPIAKQQQVEILRALAREAALIVLDEPSASLAAAEVERLHAVVRSLTQGGRTVILVSHFLREVLDLADTITVLRDGRVVSTVSADESTEASLIAAMLGRSVGHVYPPKRLPPAEAPVVLQANDLEAVGVHGVSVSLRAGEIVGLAGLVGAGRSELGRAIYGASALEGGQVTAGGRVLAGHPDAAIRAGVAYIPESRKDDGLMLHRPVRENVSLTGLGAMSRLGLIDRGAERRRVTDALSQVTGTDRLETSAVSLSGGNQQKLLFARALQTHPGVLIADEPTRGVDVGAKRDIYEVLAELAAEGMAVLLISNEVEELLGLSHRLLVMRAGVIVAELEGPAMTEEAILAAAFGTESAA